MNTESEKKQRAKRIVDLFDEKYGKEMTCSLKYEKPWQLLFATILSAQCTDERVNEITRELFVKYSSVEDFAKASPKELEKDIFRAGFYHNKARNIIKCARQLAEEYDSEVPESMECLTGLSGVGRKTANVIRTHIYSKPGIVVDTHVKRISQRLGLTDTPNPEKAEIQLMNVLPEDHWILWNQNLMRLGRTVCTSRNPACDRCFLKEECCHYRSLTVQNRQKKE